MSCKSSRILWLCQRERLQLLHGANTKLAHAAHQHAHSIQADASFAPVLTHFKRTAAPVSAGSGPGLSQNAHCFTYLILGTLTAFEAEGEQRSVIDDIWRCESSGTLICLLKQGHVFPTYQLEPPAPSFLRLLEHIKECTCMDMPVAKLDQNCAYGHSTEAVMKDTFRKEQLWVNLWKSHSNNVKSRWDVEIKLPFLQMSS